MYAIIKVYEFGFAFSYNVLENFVGVYNLVIEIKHLLSGSS